MCLTNTVNFIDFDKLTPEHRTQLNDLKQKLQARKETLQKGMNELDQKLQLLEEKLSA
jgi:hypothetical protein